MNAETRNIRKFAVCQRSIGSMIDLLSLLPADAMIVNVSLDYTCGQWVVFIEHPDFTPIGPFDAVPMLQQRDDTFRTLMGAWQMRPSALIDPATGKEFKVE